MNIDHEGAVKHFLNNTYSLKTASGDVLDFENEGSMRDGSRILWVAQTFFSDAPQGQQLRLAVGAIKDAALRYCSWKL